MDQLIGLSEHLRAWPRWQQLAGATALTLTALLGHVWLVDHLQSYQFLFFFPAVCLSALLFSEESGIWSVALSAALAAFLLFEPEGFAVSDADEALALVLFIAVGLFLCWTIGAMRRHLGALSFDLHEARAKTSQLQQAVKEDELLLREMAHRMKNDLQAIASMLDVQGRAMAPEQGGDALQAASARVRIMGRVQDRLLAGGERQGFLEVGSLIESLCSDLQASLAGLRPVSLKVEAEKVNLPVKDAVAAALIVNELVTNALKHAFPTSEPARSWFGLRSTGTTLSCLSRMTALERRFRRARSPQGAEVWARNSCARFLSNLGARWRRRPERLELTAR